VFGARKQRFVPRVWSATGATLRKPPPFMRDGSRPELPPESPTWHTSKRPVSRGKRKRMAHGCGKRFTPNLRRSGGARPPNGHTCTSRAGRPPWGGARYRGNPYMDRDTIKRRLCIALAVLAMVIVSVERACVPDARYRPPAVGVVAAPFV
jgi:hypothetical protein